MLWMIFEKNPKTCNINFALKYNKKNMQLINIAGSRVTRRKVCRKTGKGEKMNYYFLNA